MKKIEPFYQEIGRLIRSRRTKIGMSQEKLGGKLCPQVTRASIANIESGQQRVLAHTLVQLADALDVELIQLIPPQQQGEQQPATRKVAAELAEKLNLPRKQIKELTAQLSGDGSSRRKS